MRRQNAGSFIQFQMRSISRRMHGCPAKAKSQAIIGLIRYLISGVDQARILDGSGAELNVVQIDMYAAQQDPPVEQVITSV